MERKLLFPPVMNTHSAAFRVLIAALAGALGFWPRAAAGEEDSRAPAVKTQHELNIRVRIEADDRSAKGDLSIRTEGPAAAAAKEETSSAQPVAVEAAPTAEVPPPAIAAPAPAATAEGHPALPAPAAAPAEAAVPAVPARSGASPLIIVVHPPPAAAPVQATPAAPAQPAVARLPEQGAAAQTVPASGRAPGGQDAPASVEDDWIRVTPPEPAPERQPARGEEERPRPQQEPDRREDTERTRRDARDADEDARARDERRTGRDDGDPCLEFEESDGEVVEAIRALRIASGGAERPITDVRITGLRSLSEEQVWRLIGRRPERAFTTEQAAVVLTRVARTGLFREVIPTVHVDRGDGAVLELQVRELPRVERVEIDGLTELGPEEILEPLLAVPHERRDADEEEEDRDDHGGHDDDDEDWASLHIAWDDGLSTRCPAPVPPRELLARLRGGAVVPGVVWNGLPKALGRVLESLHDEGYLLATLRAELTPDGTLRLDVDEGHLDRVELVGVAPELERDVRDALRLEPGRVFVVRELESAVRRVEDRFPFLETRDADGAFRVRRRIVQNELRDGTLEYRVEEESPRRSRGRAELRDGDRRFTWTFENEDGRPRRGHISMDDFPFELPVRFFDDVPDYATIRGRTVSLHFGEDRTDMEVDWAELLRHTPVTGFAPGLGLSGTLWDPGNRVHLGADAALNLNTARRTDPIDFLVGPRLQIPSLGLAELGGHVYALTETSDRWRIRRIDSYLHSMFVNRPYADYYRRTGYAAFATFHLGRQLTVGAEYRQDQHASMDTVVGSTWFNRIRPWNTLPVDEGRMGSVIGRLEWSTRKVGMHRVGGRRREPEVSIVDRDWYEELEPGFQTVNTVEVADPRLSGDFQFVRVVSDSSLHVKHRSDQGLRLRFRAAGGRNLPLQKQEALGGWNALRGYSHKEFQGDLSALVMAEYQFGLISAFADGGSVRGVNGWITPKIGVGASLNLGDEFQLTAAWRTDERARLMPELRAVLQRTF